VLGAAKQNRTLHYSPPDGDVDWVSVSAVQGTRYVMQTGDLDPASNDTVLELYASDGTTLLARNDDFGFSYASRIAWRAPSTGTYYLKVLPRHGGINGRYSLVMTQGGSVTGRVVKQLTGAPLAGITVDLWQYDTDGHYAQFETVTNADGYYTFDVVPAGTWRVGFYDWNGIFAPVFYSNKSKVEEGTNITVTAGNTTSGINAALVSLPKTYVPVEGSNRYLTAVKASMLAYPSGLDLSGERTVVIATGRNWPDALGGTALAGVLDGPVLLVDPNSVPGAVMTEIRRLKASKAIMLGGVGALGSGVETALRTELGKGNVRRIAGSNRYATADAVAKEVISKQGSSYDGYAFVATGGNFPDALAAAPLSAARGWPLFLASPKTGLSAATQTAMAGVNKVAILGGTGAVPSVVEGQLKSRYDRRLQGTNRYATAAKVAEHGVTKGMKWDGVGIATGDNFPDALSGGAMLGKKETVLLLTAPKSLSAPTRTALEANADKLKTIHYLGGTSAVSTATRTEVRTAVR
jgi:putative cell wall-binding protein/5-hydroxyisourate hydrolase-like protein (transthyretin family)